MLLLKQPNELLWRKFSFPWRVFFLTGVIDPFGFRQEIITALATSKMVFSPWSLLPDMSSIWIFWAGNAVKLLSHKKHSNVQCILHLTFWSEVSKRMRVCITLQACLKQLLLNSATKQCCFINMEENTISTAWRSPGLTHWVHFLKLAVIERIIAVHRLMLDSH